MESFITAMYALCYQIVGKKTKEQDNENWNSNNYVKIHTKT